MKADQNDIENLASLLTMAGCNYFMGIPHGDDIMLNYQTTGFRETAALRLAHPEMSLEELGRLCDPPVGKSGINHRLRKLEIMAQELDGQETAENAGGGKADGADD